MNRLTFSIIALLIIPLISCSSDALPEKRDYPVVRTLNAEAIDSAEVRLNGSIVNTGDENIEELGFVFDTSEPAIGVSDTILISTVNSKDAFSLTTDRAFAENVEYNIRAFANTESYTIYGNRVSFLSSGTRWNPWALKVFRTYLENWANSESTYTQGKGYVLFRSGYFYELDTNDYSFSSRQKIPISGYIPESYTMFGINNHVYMIFPDYNEAYIYDTISNTWVIESIDNIDLSGNSSGFNSGNLYSFSIGLTGYVISDNTLYAYDHKTGSWSFLNQFPNEVHNAVAGNEAIYVYSYNNTIWKYNFESDDWSLETTYPSDSYDGVTAFSAGEKLYFGLAADRENDTFLQEVWEYSPGTQSWKKISRFPISYRINSPFFSISAGNKAILGFFERGDEANEDWFNVWEFDGSKIHNP
ncbi:hypothetical protein [Rhodohalobacter mucosus]|uniref:Kelch motif-containing protein n=1 Tax=Rhodohalobacter mucosus TaxID=2079485 RepID=A0A316TQ02_9BACT|nr:hypothetical protein [Rhodohalobacter mucosus]PWN06703.1 hypothetical protein DDZ15_09315 [Rhodohalobacter mucosus]